MPTSTRDQDLELWKQWKKTKSQADASRMVNQLLPLVKNDVAKYSTNIPYPVMEAYAKKLILQACENYSPSSGTALGTYVKSYMPKLIQVSNDMRSPMTIPENRSGKFTMFKSSYEGLAETLGRDPTIPELADHLGWSQAEVKRFMSEIRGEFTDDKPFVSNYHVRQSKEEEVLDYIHHDLAPKERLLFEYVTGYGGKPKLSNAEIMQRMGWNQNQLSYEKKKLSDKIERMMQR